MKKKLLIIGIVIGILLIGFVFLFPIYNNLMKNRLDNNPELNKIAQESFDEVIAGYQKALDYPSNMIDILNLDVFDMEGCMSDYNQDEGSCTVQYAYYDLNNDGIDELIIGNNIYNDILITNIYYYDGSSAKSLLGGFWYRNSVTIYENGKFIVHGANGACCGTNSYYGNIKSIGNNVDNWNDFGLVLEYEYDVEQGIHSYMKFDKNHQQTNILEKEFNKLTESFNDKVDYKKWDWKELTSNQDVKVDDKYKVYDYLYIVEQDLFVKGKAVNEEYSDERIMKNDLKTLYPKLYNVADRIKYNMSICVQASAQTNGQYKCEVDISTYVYPMIYQYPAEGTSSKAGLTEYYFKTANIYYDTDDDGYVDQAGKGIFVAPIDQFNEKVGQLLSDGTIIQNDSKTNNSSNTTTGSGNTNNISNTTTGSNNTDSSSNTTMDSNNTDSGSNTTMDSNNTGNSSNTTNQNNVDDSPVDRPTKKYLYKLVFNNFGKYYKDNFGDNGYTKNSIITFYIDGECVTDTKVDDIELRPAGSYSIYSKELSGIVNFDLYIDNKKVDTISVYVDQKMQANNIYMD
ncbi:MAG: hypothetical protein J6K23_06775 [Bacilli bacterium]|nr:hypothetical protein [Bacilli bacterium]MBP3445621.1 hypothetical protein [Bacilli bacterium]